MIVFVLFALKSITPLVITHCSNDWIPFAVKEGGVVKKIQFKILIV
jgi:hypothetical protein